MDDVIGTALCNFYYRKDDTAITVSSSITEDDVIPVTYLFRTYNEMPSIEQLALDHCKGKVLDVGAGSGCHSQVLQERGEKVAAIDLSEGAVKVMKERGIEAEKQNFYAVEDNYDTLLFLMNGIGIAGTLDQLPAFLNKARSILNPGGQIILDSSDIRYMFAEEDGSVWVNLNTEYYGEVTYEMSYQGLKTTPFNWLFVDFETLKKVATECGLKTELLSEGEHFDYLAKLTFNP